MCGWAKKMGGVSLGKSKNVWLGEKDGRVSLGKRKMCGWLSSSSDEREFQAVISV